MKIQLSNAAAVVVAGLSTFAFAHGLFAHDEDMGCSTPSRSAVSMTQNLGPANKEYDLRFVEAMIVHHEGGVTMARDALKKSSRPEVQKLARQVIAVQQKEVAQMKAWRRRWYNR